MAGKPKTLAKLVQLGYPIEMIGNKATISSKEAEIRVYDWGIKTISKKTKRVIRIYAANIKALEEIPGVESESD